MENQLFASFVDSTYRHLENPMNLSVALPPRASMSAWLFSAVSFGACLLAGSPAASASTAPLPSTKQLSTCNFSTVQAAASASFPGQTIVLPAGTCDWGANQLWILGGISLKGAGMNATIIQRTAPVPANTYLVRYDCTNGRPINFSDMTLVGANLSYSQDRGLGLIGGCVDFSVRNAKFTNFVFAGVEVRGLARQRGVIYNNQFIDNYNATVHNLGYGVVVFGDGTWPALELGSANAVFVEDNYMSGNRHHIASNNGARYVFRHNVGVSNDLTKDFPQVDAHGLSSSPRGTRSWEVYDNTFSAVLKSGRQFAGVGIRGGDGVIFRNTYTSNIASPVALILEGVACGTYPVQDQISQAFIAESSPAAVSSKCEQSIALGREYFLGKKPNYTPYSYPHPLRPR